MSVYIARRRTRAGEPRYLVRWQHVKGGPHHHLGSFKSEREAEARKSWALLELAAGRAACMCA